MVSHVHTLLSQIQLHTRICTHICPLQLWPSSKRTVARLRATEWRLGSPGLEYNCSQEFTDFCLEEDSYRLKGYSTHQQANFFVFTFGLTILNSTDFNNQKLLGYVKTKRRAEKYRGCLQKPNIPHPPDINFSMM